jgi:hypothetical protein
MKIFLLLVLTAILAYIGGMHHEEIKDFVVNQVITNNSHGKLSPRGL